MKHQLNQLNQRNQRRRLLTALTAGVLLPPLRSIAAEPPLIGYLLLQPLQPTPTPERQAFLDGLREQGLIEGRDYRILYKSAEMESDFLEDAARDLVKAGVRLIVATGGASVTMARKVTQSIPIVGISMTDPVPRFAKSLARPGGNITGLANLQFDLAAKRVQLLKEMVPQMRSFAVIWNAAGGARPAELAEMQRAAAILKLKLIPASVRDAAELTRVFARLRRERPDAIHTVIDPQIASYSSLIAGFARAEKIPTMSGLAQFTRQGGLASYAPDLATMFRRAGFFVKRILGGTLAGDLPIEQPTRIEFIVNLKTAREIGLTVPPVTLLRADRVIE